MFDLKLLQKHPEIVRQSLAKRRADQSLVDEFLSIDERRRAMLTEVEALKNERNTSSALVAKNKREGIDCSELIARLGALSDRIKDLDVESSRLNDQVSDLLLRIPNIPHDSVPVGNNETDNPVIELVGQPTSLPFPAKDHVDLGTAAGGLDFERAAKITGARFVVYRDWAARLERALISFMLDLHTIEHGYTEIMPPVVVNRQSLIGTGQLPKFEEDLFALTGTDMYLIPTAEVPLTNLHRDETLPESLLPLAYVAYTPCFRSEAGSYGKDTRGIIRQHQFNKVELVRFCRPEESYQQLELLRGHAEEVLRRLELPYRVISLCTGDLGFASAKTYDLEVWMPGQTAYREISSCSNFVDFQARRAGIRFKPSDPGQKTAFAHTLNGSGLAIGRTMVAILENYQQADGSIVVPKVLRPYMKNQELIPARP